MVLEFQNGCGRESRKEKATFSERELNVWLVRDPDLIPYFALQQKPEIV